MADLNKYDDKKHKPSTSEQMAEMAKAQAKRQIKKKAKNKAKDAFHKATDNQFRGIVPKAKALLREGLKHLLNMAKQAVKQLASAAAKGVTALAEFLVSNPVGWVILAIIIIIIVIFCIKKGIDKKKAAENDFMDDAYATIMLSDADCKGVKKKMDAQEAASDADNQRHENAKQIYAVFHEYGLTDEQIAGMLGNFQVESGQDPTTLEGVYDEAFQVGEKTLRAFEDMDDYCRNTLFPLYRKCGTKHTPANYMADGKYWCGVGLVQWTAGGCQKLIERAGDNDWFGLEFQLAYILCDKYCPTGKTDFLKNWRDNGNDSATATDAAVYFRHNYEGNTGNGFDADAKDGKGCETYAEEWLSTIQSEGWAGAGAETDPTTSSIFEMASNMAEGAIDTATVKSKSRCQSKLTGYDNSSLAAAAVSYAYATKEEGKGNNGTALYKKVHDNVFPGDSTYMSCDRSVGAAVRWSGADDEFPSGRTNEQYDRMLAATDIWESVGFTGDEGMSTDKLEPGDILVLDGHILMYVGHELIEERHGNNASKGADSVSGSLGERSPGCGEDTTNIIRDGDYKGRNGRGGSGYQIFRCINPHYSDTYKDAGG